MHTRIKELMTLAGFDPAGIERMGVMPQAEKFAELLIADVTECVRDVVREETSDLTWIACSQVQDRINEHFGVK
jgi:hypothetical protein